MHVVPRHAFEKTVVGQDTDVLREIGMINPARLQVQHLGGEEGSETNRSWRADDDLGESFTLDVIEHSEDGRETELLQFVFGQFEFADRLKVFDRNIRDAQLAPRSDDG